MAIARILGTLLLALAPPQTGAPASPAPQAEAKAKLETFVVLMRIRHDLWLRYKATGKWPEEDKAANAALEAHGTYWKALRESGRALLAGGMEGDYWDNVALIVFQAPSLQEAEAIVAADPAVKTYVFQAQVRPFGLHWSQAPRD